MTFFGILYTISGLIVLCLAVVGTAYLVVEGAGRAGRRIDRKRGLPPIVGHREEDWR